jgi:thiol reductant ABC exporter CydC subunit
MPGTPLLRFVGAGVLGLAASAAGVGLLAGSGYVVGRAALHPGLGALAGILAAVEVLAFLRGPLRYAERLVGHDAALRSQARWRVWLYDVLTLRVPAALAGWRSGDLLARAVDDVDTLQDLYLRTLLPATIAVATAVLGIVVVGLTLPVAALALGIPLGLAATVPPLLAWREAGADAAVLNGALSAHVVDVVRGMPELLAFGAQERADAQLSETATALEEMDRGAQRAQARGALVTHLCQGAALMGVLAVTVSAVHAHHVGRVMAAVLPLAALATFEPLPGLAQAAARARSAATAAERLLSLEAVPIPVSDPAMPGPAPTDTPDVTFDRVSLRYAPDLPRSLDGVSLNWTAGSSLALTGSSGSGKTSLLHALLRFWPLEAGTLTLADVPVDQLAEADVRAICSLADQRAHLFAGTVRATVAFSRPDATDADVIAALEVAQLDDWLESLPAGLDSPVGEDGVAVSGGERRRLAVARAVLDGGPLLLLDEPTAGLDAALADRLVRAVLESAGGRSVLLVTHRSGEAALCASTVALEAGRLVAD